MNRALEAYKFFLKKCPKASADDVYALLDLLHSFSTLIGGASMMFVEKKLERAGLEWNKSNKDAIDEAFEDFEDMYWPHAAKAQFLKFYFDIDPSEDYDPVGLRDSFNFDPEVMEFFRKHEEKLKKPRKKRLNLAKHRG